MSTVVTHAFVGLVAGRLAFPGLRAWKLSLWAMGCSVLPDADVTLRAFGVRYQDLWGHRGMMHSVLFAVIVGLIVASWPFRRETPPMSGRWWALWAFFAGITASHGLIDMFTDGGLGIAMLAPFDQTRYFMPWRPLAVPYIGLTNLFTRYTGRVLLTEALWVWTPLILVATPLLVIRRPSTRPRRIVPVVTDADDREEPRPSRD